MQYVVEQVNDRNVHKSGRPIGPKSTHQADRKRGDTITIKRGEKHLPNFNRGTVVEYKYGAAAFLFLQR